MISKDGYRCYRFTGLSVTCMGAGHLSSSFYISSVNPLPATVRTKRNLHVDRMCERYIRCFLDVVNDDDCFLLLNWWQNGEAEESVEMRGEEGGLGGWAPAKVHSVTSLSTAKSHNSYEQPCPGLHMPALSEERWRESINFLSHLVPSMPPPPKKNHELNIYCLFNQ